MLLGCLAAGCSAIGTDTVPAKPSWLKQAAAGHQLRHAQSWAMGKHRVDGGNDIIIIISQYSSSREEAENQQVAADSATRPSASRQLSPHVEVQTWPALVAEQAAAPCAL